VSEGPTGPSEAIRLLYRAVAEGGVNVVPAFFAQDLANVRRSRPLDKAFAAAVLAIAKEIHLAAGAPDRHGIAIRHALEGWRRSKFSALGSDDVHLRLIFRPSKKQRIDILAFSDREFPESVYLTAKVRL
jgi:hypothetical protein